MIRFKHFAVSLAVLASLSARAQFGPPPEPGPPPIAKQVAPFDLTGYWVSIVTEDWRFRMITPNKGDYPGVPINKAATKIAEAWDPAKDEAAGEQCKSYGAPSIMRVPGRFHITWQDDKTLKVEADAGTQTRIFNFYGTPTGNPSWQGYSVATWQPLATGGFGPPKYGHLKVVTSRLRPGYLRKNGVPYSDKATVTEYWDLLNDPNSTTGEVWLMIKTIVDDPTYLLEPFVTSTHLRKQADGMGFAPSACAAR